LKTQEIVLGWLKKFVNYVNEKGAILMNNKKPPKGKIDGFFVHALADVSPLATIGKNTKIWRFSHIDDYATLGNNVMIAQCCYVAPGVKIGDNVRVQNGVSIFRGCYIHDNVFIGPNVTFTNVVYPKIFRSATYSDTVIKEGATLGANCTIIAGVTIGKHAFVGAGSVVTHDVPDYALVVGNPARIIKQLSPDWKEFDK
jgi:UDP-2-acetamido-3-amino-2,3-dideoxy-glucuronate N-acetyltransferase